MTISQLASMPNEVSKITLYLSYVAIDVYTFDLRRITKKLNISNSDFLVSLKYLFDLNIIDFNVDEQNCKLYLMHLKHSIDINIQKWGFNSINLLNEIIFEWEPIIMTHLINHIYRPIGKYDEKTMGKFFDPDIPLNPIELSNEIKEKFVKNKERRQLRKEKKERAITLVDNFYQKLSNYVSIQVSQDMRNNEIKIAQEFITFYPELPQEYLNEAIDWLLNDPFWSKIVISIKTFKKHFPKYLISHKKIKKVKHLFKLI